MPHEHRRETNIRRHKRAGSCKNARQPFQPVIDKPWIFIAFDIPWIKIKIRPTAPYKTLHSVYPSFNKSMFSCLARDIAHPQ